jgi:hypothetical protein
VPAFRADPDGAGPLTAPPTEQLLAILEGKDELGATARPAQELVLDVANALPDVRFLDDVRPYGGLVATPIDILVEYRDADDSPERVTLTWKAFSPSLTEINLTELTGIEQPSDTKVKLAGQRLVPTLPGTWEIRVTARDSIGEEKTVLHETMVVDDSPPCIEQHVPLAPPAGNVLPLTEPTLFQVPLVSDQLDRYPGAGGSDPLLGETRFAWSIKRANGPRESLAGTTANSLAVDPATYELGEQIEVRVEVFDRNDNAIICADDAATCSNVGTDCIQRLTWRVEAR